MATKDFRKDFQVSKQKVSFQSEELNVVGNLFRPPKPMEDESLPAVLVAGAMTGV
jgi:fermentation-respiration switch protein FrsA (DUF1100 family)